MHIVVEVVIVARALHFVLDAEIMNNSSEPGLTVSCANRNARTEVASCTRQRTR